MPVDMILTGRYREPCRGSPTRQPAKPKRSPTHVIGFWSGAPRWRKDIGHPMHLWYAGLRLTPKSQSAIFFSSYSHPPHTPPPLPSARAHAPPRSQPNLSARYCNLTHIHGMRKHLVFVLYKIKSFAMVCLFLMQPHLLKHKKKFSHKYFIITKFLLVAEVKTHFLAIQSTLIALNYILYCTYTTSQMFGHTFLCIFVFFLHYRAIHEQDM